MVIFLVGLVSMIMLRTLRKDYARYSREEDITELVRKKQCSHIPYIECIQSCVLRVLIQKCITCILYAFTCIILYSRKYSLGRNFRSVCSTSQVTKLKSTKIFDCWKLNSIRESACAEHDAAARPTCQYSHNSGSTMSDGSTTVCASIAASWEASGPNWPAVFYFVSISNWAGHHSQYLIIIINPHRPWAK